MKNIMVIDDDVQYVDTVKDFLEAAGYGVSYAYQAEKGMAQAREIKPDLILLDVMFAGPAGPDGFEIARKMKNDVALKGIPVIIVSGVQKFNENNYTLEPDNDYMPVTAFLEKPIRPDTLLTEVRKALN